MKTWNTPDHHIADTEHGTLTFTDGVTLVIADWQFTENAPDSDGRIYAEVSGWLVNGGGTGRVDDPHTEPIEAGRARLVRTELRGRTPLADRDVLVAYYSPGQPYPNTWDHVGTLVTVSWMDRRVDQSGQPIPDGKTGSTEWTHPDTGQVFDLTAAYVPAGDSRYNDPDFTWRHHDRWSDDVPLLHPFFEDHMAPLGDGKRITDGQWVKAATVPEPGGQVLI